MERLPYDTGFGVLLSIRWCWSLNEILIAIPSINCLIMWVHCGFARFRFGVTNGMGNSVIKGNQLVEKCKLQDEGVWANSSFFLCPVKFNLDYQ